MNREAAEKCIANETEELRKRLADFMGYADWKLRIWHPDLQIEQAMMIAERIISEGGEFALDINQAGSEAVFYNHGFDCKAETPALAICLAADSWLKKRQAATA